MAGFSGATGVPLKQMQDAIAQSTAKETIALPSSSFNSKLTIDSANTYCVRSGNTAMISISASANAAIPAWEQLITSLPARAWPIASSNGYAITIGAALAVANFSGGILNTASAISSGANVRFVATYICSAT